MTAECTESASAARSATESRSGPGRRKERRQFSQSRKDRRERARPTARHLAEATNQAPRNPELERNSCLPRGVGVTTSEARAGRAARRHEPRPMLRSTVARPAGRSPVSRRHRDDELDPPLPPAPVGIPECLVVMGLGPSPSQGGYCTRVGGVLARGRAYCTKPGPSWSAPDCRPVAPHPRAVRAQRHHSDHTRPFGDATNRVPSATRSSTPLPARRPATPAPGNPPHLCLRCHDIRNPQTP